MIDPILSKEEIIREEIISTSQKLFQRYGFQKTTMEDIAKMMGKGKSTLYYYYKSKEEIFEAVILKEAEEVTTIISNATKTVYTAEEKLKIYLFTSLDAIKKTLNLYEVMRTELYDGECSLNFSFCCQPSMREALRHFNTKQNKVIKDILIFGIENKEFSTKLYENIDVVSYVILTGIRSLALELALEENDNADFLLEENKLNALVNIFIKGLRD